LRSYDVEGPRTAMLPSTTYDVGPRRTLDTVLIIPYS
jgi:hypothetical protein